MVGTTDTNEVTDIEGLQLRAQNFLGGLSEKYVPTPSNNEILRDFIDGFRIFANSIRWAFYRKQEREDQGKGQDGKRVRAEKGEGETWVKKSGGPRGFNPVTAKGANRAKEAKGLGTKVRVRCQ